MQGVILDVGEAQGLILGDDGQRYTFMPLEWRRDDEDPRVDMRVDFEAHGTEAAGVYPIPGAAPAAQAQPPAPSPSAPPVKPPAPPAGPTGKGKMQWWRWALAGGGALVVLGGVAAFALGLFGSSGPPVGREIARHAHEGQVYVLVEYGDELAVFSGSGSPVTQRSLAGDVLRSYAWGQVVAGFDTGKLAGVSDRVRRLDDGVSDARRLSNGVVAIFDELDGMKANIPILGSISAMDVVRESFDGVEEAETLVRNLDSELNALGDNAASLSRASEGILGVEPSSVSGREMESLFAGASGAARDLESTVRDVGGFVSDTADAASDLERALRAGSDTPVIGDALGNFAVRVGRFESVLSGLSGLMGEFESELGALAQDMENGIDSAAKTLQADLDRWLAEPYDTEWPPADPERRPAGIAQAPAASSAPTPQAAERRPSEVARAAVPAATPSNTPSPEPTSAPVVTPTHMPATPTNTPAPTPTTVLTNTPVPAATPTHMPTRTVTPTRTPGPTSAAAPTNTPVPTPIPSPTATPTHTPTPIPSPTATPTHTPASGRIVFMSEQDGDWEVYVMNADGSGVTRLTDNEADDTGPRWSPNGRRIAFSSNRDGDWDIYVMNADGFGRETADRQRDERLGATLVTGRRAHRVHLEPRR